MTFEKDIINCNTLENRCYSKQRFGKVGISSASFVEVEAKAEKRKNLNFTVDIPPGEWKEW